MVFMDLSRGSPWDPVGPHGVPDDHGIPDDLHITHVRSGLLQLAGISSRTGSGQDLPLLGQVCQGGVLESASHGVCAVASLQTGQCRWTGPRRLRRSEVASRCEKFDELHGWSSRCLAASPSYILYCKAKQTTKNDKQRQRTNNDKWQTTTNDK